jgi:hypothetical protein
MKRIEIMIDEDLDAVLGVRAAREGVSKATLVRRYVREGLHALPQLYGDPLSDVVGMVKRGSPNDSSRIDGVVGVWTPDRNYESVTHCERCQRPCRAAGRDRRSGQVSDTSVVRSSCGHRKRATACAISSRLAKLWPLANTSICGSAAFMPLARGA